MIPEMPKIELDKNTLPKDGQHVKWLVWINDVEAIWKEGEYLAKEQLFIRGPFNGSYSSSLTISDEDFDSAWHVLRWEAVNSSITVRGK